MNAGRARIFALLVCCAGSISGCVVGYGPCLALQPFTHTLEGRVHFRDFPQAEGVDNVPVLELDQTAYLYAPAQSTHCLSANDMQLVGVSEFPENVGENAHVRVEGHVFEASSRRQYTGFLIGVTSISLLAPPH